MSEIPCTSSPAHTSMSDEDDGSEIEPELCVTFTDSTRKKGLERKANRKRKIEEKKRKRQRQSGVSPNQSSSSKRNPHSDPQILPGGSGQSVLNPPPVSHPPLNVIISDPSGSSNEHSFQVIQETDHLVLNQQNSINNPDGSSNFLPSYAFRNLLYSTNDNEAEETSCEQRIFQPNFPMDVLSEDQHILKELRNIFESEGMLNYSTSEAKTLNMRQTAGKDVFQIPSHQDCYDWNKFPEPWEDMHIASGSTSKAQHHKLKTIKEPEDSLPTKKNQNRKESSENSSQSAPLSGEAKKQPCFADNLETITCASFKSTSTDKEHSSNPKVLSSFEKEMEMIVHPVSLDDPETSIASKLLKFAKNTKADFLDDSEMPPVSKKITSLLGENSIMNPRILFD